MIGLNAIAIYGNYYYIMGAVFSLVSIIATSLTASIVNSLAKEPVKKNYDDMRKILFALYFCAPIRRKYKSGLSRCGWFVVGKLYAI